MKGHVRHRHKGACPPRCRNSAPWQAIVYTGRDPITGRKHYRSATRPTRSLAERAKAELIVRYAGKASAPADLTVAGLLERWLADARLSPTTRQRTRSIIDRSILPYIGGVRIAKLDDARLDALYRHLERHGRKCNVCWSRIARDLPALRHGEAYATSSAAGPRARCGAPTLHGPCRKWPRKHAGHCERHGGAEATRPLDRVHQGDCVAGLPAAASTIRRVHTTLRSALAYAIKRRWLDANPAEQAEPPAVKRAKTRPPNREDVVRLLDAARRSDADADFEWCCWLRLDAVTGARRGEVCAVQWRDLDWDDAAVVMEHSVALDTDEHGRPILENGRRRLVRKETKAGTSKRPELDPVTLALLAEWRRRVVARARSIGVDLVADAYVFSPDVQGRTPWPPDTMTQRFRRLRARLGLDAVTLKDLRHFAASAMLRGGIDLVRAAARTGHDEKTLLAFYAHYMGGGREASDLLANLFDAPAGLPAPT
jgi:integrase